MKKTIAMLLAATTTMTAGVTAMASDMNLRDEVLGLNTAALTDSEVTDSETPETPDTETPDGETPDTETPDGETPDTETPDGETPDGETPDGDKPDEGEKPDGGEEDVDPNAEPTSLVFGKDLDNDLASLNETILAPGTEYKFPVSVVIDGKTKPLTDAIMSNFKFTYSRVTSNSVKRFEIENYKGAYYLFVETKDSISTKLTDVKYNVKLVRKENNLSVFSQEVKFQYGYDESDADYISGLDKGDTVEIDNNRPVITANQFDKIAKINDYKNVTLAGPSWAFTVNVTDESTKNMLSNNAGIKDVLAEFTDHDFKFFNFPGKPSFSAMGRVQLDVSDIIDEYENLYTYRYADGKIYKINATLNSDDQVLEFRTNKLDTFLVTNKEIKNGHTIKEDVKGDTIEGEGGNTNDNDKEVPNTGASDMIAAAVAAAMASMAAGVLAAKKRK